MNKAVTVKQIQRLDTLAIEGLGLPSSVLMENAGSRLAAEALKSLKGRKKVLVVCGLGNNAGDGFVAARHLIERGLKVRIFLLGKAGQLKGDARTNYLILRKLKCPIVGAHGRAPLRDIKDADVIIDAIFGVGLNREIGEPFKGFIETLNREAKMIISADVPSGLDGTTGDIYGVCINAHKTVTFTFMKKGFLRKEGPRHTGKVVVVDIGIPGRLKRRIIS